VIRRRSKRKAHHADDTDGQSPSKK